MLGEGRVSLVLDDLDFKAHNLGNRLSAPSFCLLHPCYGFFTSRFLGKSYKFQQCTVGTSIKTLLSLRLKKKPFPPVFSTLTMSATYALRICARASFKIVRHIFSLQRGCQASTYFRAHQSYLSIRTYSIATPCIIR